MYSSLRSAATIVLFVAAGPIIASAADPIPTGHVARQELQVADACPPLPRSRLMGTLCIATPAASQAFVEDLESGRHHVLHLDGPLGRYRVSSIAPDTVVFTGDGCRGAATLTLAQAPASSSAAPLPATVALEPGPSPRVLAVRSGSLIERLGVAPADVLAAVNAHEIQTTGEARDALARLDDASLESIAVRRNGHLVVFVNRSSTTARTFLTTAQSRREGDGAAASPDGAAHGKLPEPQEEP